MALARLRSLWRNLRHRDRIERDLDDELAATLDLLIDENISAGSEPLEARRLAMIELNRIEPIKERVRDVRAGILLETIAGDVKYAVRHFRRSPGFALSAILTLAIGIGANTAMTSVLNALVYKRLPVPDPDGLISFNTYDERGRERYLPYLAVAPIAEAGPFKSVCGYNGGGVSAADVNGTAAMSLYAFVSGRCFETFGVMPFMGRPITDEDAPLIGPGRKVAVISHRFWTRRFGADPAVLGRTLRLESAELTVIGVTPEGFGGLHVDTAVDIFVPPDTIIPSPKERRPVASPFVGRLRDGVTLEQASAQLATLWPRVKPLTIGDPSKSLEGASLFGDVIKVERIGTGISTLRRTYAAGFEIMSALTALLLVLMCVNVGGLLLTRLGARTNELSIRLALGGSRYRVAQQLLIEGLLLALCGTVLAIPLAFTMIAPIDAFMPQNRIERTIALSPDATVLVWTTLAGLCSGVLISALPVWLAVRRQVATPFAWDRTMAPATSWWSRGLLVSQVAVSVVIVIGASLLVRSLYLLERVDTGVKADHLIDVDVFPLPGGRAETNAAYFATMLERMTALPGVTSVGASQAFPRQRFPPTTPVSFVGAAPGDVLAMGDTVSPRFFETIGVPLIAGRVFDWSDSAAGRQVCIVTEALARALSPTGDVLQRHVRYGTQRDRQDLTIVGIVANVNMGNLRVDQPPILFTPPAGATFVAPNLLIATSSSIESTSAAVRRILADGGRDYAREIVTVRELFARAPSTERITATIAGVMGALAVLLAVVGIHGVLAYSVSRRTREIGVRVAIGANPGTVAGSIIREAATLTAIGVAIGLPAAFFSSRTLRALLFGVTENDAATFLVSAVCVLLLGVIAGVLPARRAARIDPVIALRSE
jgi:predicted permease